MHCAQSGLPAGPIPQRSSNSAKRLGTTALEISYDSFNFKTFRLDELHHITELLHPSIHTEDLDRILTPLSPNSTYSEIYSEKLNA